MCVDAECFCCGLWTFCLLRQVPLLTTAAKCPYSFSHFSVKCCGIQIGSLVFSQPFQVPEGMDPIAAAPLMCAGVTVFNALRGNIEKAKVPALVAVVG